LVGLGGRSGCMKSFRIVIPPWYPRSRIARRMTWALVTPSTTTRWVMYSLKGSSLLGCLPRRYRRVGPSFRLRATVLRSIPRRMAISVFDRPFSKSSRTFITSSPRSTESPPLGREFGDSGSLRVRIFHSAISRSFASAVLTHFIPATTRVPKHAQPMVAALVRTIFAQPDLASAREQLEHVAANLDRRFPQAAALLRDAMEDVLAYMAFPAEHWRRIHSTNVLERLNRELARRCDIVGIFPNVAAAPRLLGALLEEQQDEWLVSRRYFSLESMAKIDANPPREDFQLHDSSAALKVLAV